MADATSEDEYIDHAHGQGQPSPADGERASDAAAAAAAAQQARQPEHARSGPREEDEPAPERPSSPARRVVHKSDAAVQARPGAHPAPRRRRPSHKHTRTASPSAPPRQKKVGARGQAFYQGVLDGMACDENDAGACDASRIGASCWTGREKAALFRHLRRHGRGASPALARAVATKSLAEVHVYLSLLHDASRAPGSGRPPRREDVHLPAACEISAECEAALEAVADAQAARGYEREMAGERARHGDRAVVDREAAELDELVYVQQLQQQQHEAERDAHGEEVEGGAEGEASSPVLSKSAFSHSTATSDQASLLRQPVLLQLMRSIFMNNGGHRHLNWHHMEPSVEGDPREPAICRSAMDDLATITENVTRRIVQAALFQAMTRLRAGDSSRTDWTPVAAVREVDVRRAVHVLGLEPKWRHYWATVVRRNRLSVYSDSKKYKDRRPGTKTGRRLTDDEVRLALGCEPGGAAGPGEEEEEEEEDDDDDDAEEAEIGEAEVDDLMHDSDLFTDIDDGSGDDSRPAADPGGEDTGSSRPVPRKRRRALSPRAVARADDAYLETVDRQRSREEEVRLWKGLGWEPPRLAPGYQARKIAPPAVAGSEPEKLPLWRDTTEYVDDWEQSTGHPGPDAFRATESEGRRRRKRRKALEKMVNARCAGPRRGDGDSDHVQETEGRIGESDESGGKKVPDNESSNGSEATRSEDAAGGESGPSAQAASFSPAIGFDDGE